MATTTTETTGRTVSGFGPLQIAITILVALTALVHLLLGVGIAITLMSQPTQGATMVAILAVLFLCNFGGYVVLNAALYLPVLRRYQRVTRVLPVLRRYQRVTRVLLIGYTALTIVAYFAIDGAGALNPIGLSDKAVEAALIALLVIDGRRARA